MTVPTVGELRMKAEETRAQAAQFTQPALQRQMAEIAAEYERLAKRAEAFAERARLGLNNDDALTNWLD